MKARGTWFGLTVGLALSLGIAEHSGAAVCGDNKCEAGEAFSCPVDCGGELSMDSAGDSLTKAVNAQRIGNYCNNGPQENFNWATSNTHGGTWCGPGWDGVMSHAERIECSRSGDINVATPNHALSGATMLEHFGGQANGIHSYLSANPAPRYATVFLGHNDLCRSTIDKVSPDQCGGNPDLDPSNYCRTSLATFEREFRKGLDILVTIPDTHIGVAAPLRVSQYCNFGNAPACQLFASKCQNLWANAQNIGIQLCRSLTKDCSSARIIDAYLTGKAYREILEQVSFEYASIPAGSQTPLIWIGGQWVGGATKASGVTVLFSNATWRYKLKASQITCCDCLHFAAEGQQALSRILFDGLTCSSTDQCCAETGDPLTDAKCAVTEASGFYGGIY